ncbi:hypothetical protein BaRGS_00021919 [Batillaria attramentaria]|uniref:Poly [ADP-ribose] polymerase n=1 Tax=Batillaria attramentaria TaxID=370345 RepID=A0ABD0KIJ7_9CAEN
MAGSRAELKRIIVGKIKEDPLAADLRWSLFVAALHSYRCDTVLRPFPPRFIDHDDEKNTEGLKSAADEIPGILHMALRAGSISFESLELLAWVLDDPSFKLHTLNKSQFSSIQQKTGHITPVPDPSYIFEVEYSKTMNDRFESLQNGRKIMYAYHGSRIENFHSILHNGLAGHMNKMSLFGKGTYLSSELAVSLIYSPGGQGWRESQLGSNLGCVAVCEVIDDPSVKCSLREGSDSANTSSNSTPKRRARASESQAGDVPERYYVVENNEMVRVKYLLLYSQNATGVTHERSPVVIPWYRKNKFAVLMAFYLFVLLSIGLFSSKSFQFYLRRLLRSYSLR